MFWADFETVTQIDVELEGEKHTLTSRLIGEEDEQERIWAYSEEALEETTEEAGETYAPAEGSEEEGLDISGVKDALLNLSADSFTEERPTEVEEIGVTLHLDNVNFPTVEVQLYRYDGSFCLAVVDGDPVSLVSRSAVMDLVEAVQTIVLNS